MPLIEELPDIDAALARLDAAEAAETQAAPTATETADEQVLDQPGDTTGDGVEPQPDSKPTDTPAGAEPKQPTEPKDTETPKPGEKPANEPNKSKFAKDQERRDRSWKALNTEKEAHAKAVADFKAQQQAFEQQKQRFESERTKASQKYTPEQYETASGSKVKVAQELDLQADGMEARAAKLDEEGKYGEAQLLKNQAREKREQAAGERGLSRQLKQMADHLRANPDPSAQQVAQQQQAAMKHYTLEAAKQWPDVAKEGSEFQKTMAGHLKAAADAGLDPKEFPVLMYHAARLTAAETDAARVPGMEKELVGLRAKVKELEALTNPGGGRTAAQQLPAKTSPKTLEEEGEELRAMAMGMS